jgi:hypothetical protein
LDTAFLASRPFSSCATHFFEQTEALQTTLTAASVDSAMNGDRDFRHRSSGRSQRISPITDRAVPDYRLTSIVAVIHPLTGARNCARLRLR